MGWQEIEHYARLRGGERPSPRSEFGRAPTRVALVYPNSYYVGMSNLGFQTVYGIANSTDGLLCDRFFPLDWPSPDPPLSLECERPLPDFDVVAFSVAFENDYVNMLRTLDMARIPFRSDRRDSSHPLILVGGAVTFLNPEPIASFADLIALGEVEEISSRLFEVIAASKRAQRRELLEAAAEIDGVYVPALSPDGPHLGTTPARSRWEIGKIPREYISHSAIVAEGTEFRGTFLIEISRGCPYGCRFCAVGHAYPRLRRAEAHDLLEIVERGLRTSRPRPPFSRVGLVSSAVGSHPELDAICEGLRRMGLGVTVSSLRVDRLSDVMLRCLAESGTRTVAIAPEAGSERLRLVLDKEITEEVVLDGAARAVDHGIPNLKLYFMVGLPTETEEDIDALMDLTIKVRKIMDGSPSERSKLSHPGAVAMTAAAGEQARSTAGVSGSLTVSIAPFVPKPMTPLQWSPMAAPTDVKRKISMIRRGLGRVRGVRVTSETLKSAYLQGILSRGGRDMAPFLEETCLNGGDWRRAAADTGLDLDKCLGERDFSEVSPWHYMLDEERRVELALGYRRALSLVKE